jgi:hypothetical protein
VYRESYVGYGDDVETHVSSRQVFGDLTWLLPELNSRVPCPNVLTAGAPRLASGEAYCASHEDTVRGIVIHLNDRCGWSREQVADWLDSLDVDLTFPTEAPPRPPERHWAPFSDTMIGGYATGGLVQWQAVVWNSYSYYQGVAEHFIVFDAENQYKQLATQLLQGISIDTAWLKVQVEENEESEKPQLKADAEAPDLLKRPDGTALPELTTDVFMMWADGATSVVQNVTLDPSVLAEFDAKRKRKPKPRPQPALPAAKNFNYLKKGQPRGKHSRT